MGTLVLKWKNPWPGWLVIIGHHAWRQDHLTYWWMGWKEEKEIYREWGELAWTAGWMVVPFTGGWERNKFKDQIKSLTFWVPQIELHKSTKWWSHDINWEGFTAILQGQRTKGLVTQLCLTLCDPMDCGPPGSSGHGIFQARILEWVAIPFSKGPSQPRDWTQVSHIAGGIFTSWATGEAQLGWVAYPFSSVSSWPRNWTQGSPASQADSLLAELQGKPVRETKAGLKKVICVCVFVYLSFEMLIALLHWIDRYSI